MVAQAAGGRNLWEDLTGGIRYVAREPTLRMLMIVALVMPLFNMPVQQMLPVFAKDVFDSGGGGLGLMAAASGLGGLAGAMIAANLDARSDTGRLMLLGGLAMGMFIIGFAISPGLIVASIALIAMSIGQMLFQATNNTAIQAGLPPDVRGRVMAIMMMSFGLSPLGVLPVTVAADSVGAPTAMAASGGVLLVVLLVLWALSPHLRRLRTDGGGLSTGHQLVPAQGAVTPEPDVSPPAPELVQRAR
jgi:MFS family permease